MPYFLALLQAEADAEMYPAGAVTIEQDADAHRLVMHGFGDIMGFYPYED